LGFARRTWASRGGGRLGVTGKGKPTLCTLFSTIKVCIKHQRKHEESITAQSRSIDVHVASLRLVRQIKTGGVESVGALGGANNARQTGIFYFLIALTPCIVGAGARN